jgi:hypothetical protein
LNLFAQRYKCKLPLQFLHVAQGKFALGAVMFPHNTLENVVATAIKQLLRFLDKFSLRIQKERSEAGLELVYRYIRRYT